MSDSSSWTVHLGRWWRVSIRLHAVFIAVAVFALYLSTSGPARVGLACGVLSVAILFASVLVHELAHWLAALRAGTMPDPIVIGPLGGLGPREIAREPQMELVVAAAGPLANLAVVLLAAPALWACGESVTALVSPIEPVQLTQGALWTAALKLGFWINWLLLTANLLPAFPFDGARLLRGLLWPAMEYRGATLLAVRASKLTAVGLCVVAWLVSDLKSADALPAWVPIVLVAAMIYFSAQQEATRLEESDWEEEMLNYDFSQGYTSLERASQSPRRAGSSVKRWLENRREMRRRRRRSQEQDEERQVDAILMRLHETGMEGLSAKERALLERVSARYRNRQRS